MARNHHDPLSILCYNLSVSDPRIGRSFKESHRYCLEQFLAKNLKCKQCNNALTYKQRHNSFCSRTCARIFTNSVLYPLDKRRKCRTCQLTIGSKNDTHYCSVECKANGKQKKRFSLSIEEARTPASIRKVMLRDFGHMCMVCHNTTWLDQPIPIEVDHVNGLSYDNRPENLRLLCCNCHALTPTFRSKNRGNGRKSRRAIRPLAKSSDFQSEEAGSKPA